MIVIVPVLSSIPVPTTALLSLLIISTVPLVTGVPVFSSVTLIVMVVFLTLVLVTVAVVVLFNLTTLMFSVAILASYILFPGYSIVNVLVPTAKLSNVIVAIPSVMATFSLFVPPGNVIFTSPSKLLPRASFKDTVNVVLRMVSFRTFVSMLVVLLTYNRVVLLVLVYTPVLSV